MIAEKIRKVGLERLPGNELAETRREHESYSVDVEGEKYMLAVLKREPDQVILALDERVFAVRQFERTDFSVTFLSNNQLVISDIKGSKTSSSQESISGGGIASVDENVVANFPAKVVEVNIKKGDILKQNDTLLVLEAMKMESQIKTPKDCTVSDVLVKEGAIVERGTLLAKLKFG